MVVIEVNLPTGYLVDEDSLPSHKDFDDLKQVDIGNGVTKVLIYFDKIDKIPVCPTITAYCAFKVANIKPASICVYDFYDNGKTIFSLFIFEYFSRFLVIHTCNP